MSSNNRHYIILLLWAVLTACNAVATQQSTVKRDFEARKEALNLPGYYTIFDRQLDDDRREALEFLYAYMPLPDLTDYTGDFYLENVDCSLRARKEMPWGASVPDREWRHFVLPVRVNNENLDSSRMVFYNELRDRVKGLSMRDAVLEVNHWCHEKVTYQPSDSRTSSPLASIKSAYGRCGEESTFTVAALRAVGIPARQVYTPRWAHTDDNHAWVEAWVDGRWYFLGACEPEAVLNLGWFNAPASRGMLMNTKTFGRYDGPEQQLAQSPCYTEINVTANYAPVDSVMVTVVDSDGNQAAGARVDYKLYNYAEFYSIASRRADEKGKSTLTTGRGDLLVWATDGESFGFKKCTVGKDREIVVTLDHRMPVNEAIELDIVPPVQAVALPEVTPEQARENDRRKAQEDSLRGAYMATFFTPERGAGFARSVGLDTAAVAKVLVDSRGNHDVVTQFLSEVSTADRERALRLLQVVSDKDRRDITLDVLRDHLATPVIDSKLYDEYVMNPRVANEMLTPYKAFFRKVIPADKRERYRDNPQEWVAWCADSIAIDRDWNPQNLAMAPASVWTSRITDARSRNIFFVAASRSMGLPARIDPVTEKTQYAAPDGRWIDADFTEPLDMAVAPQGTLRIDFTPQGRITDPQYYSHFTLSRIVNGVPVLLNYPEDATWSSTFANPSKIDAGQYMLTSGQRMADGSVLAYTCFFNVEDGETATPKLVMRQDASGVQVIGSFNSENIYHDSASGDDKSILSTTGRGYYVLGLLSPNHEPTVHALNDISLMRDELEKWGGSIVLLFNDSDDASRMKLDRFKNLPATVTFGNDIDGNISREIIEGMELPTGDRPIFIIADTFNRIVFLSQGYTIGLGEQLVDILHRIGRN